LLATQQQKPPPKTVGQVLSSRILSIRKQATVALLRTSIIAVKKEQKA